MEIEMERSILGFLARVTRFFILFVTLISAIISRSCLRILCKWYYALGRYIVDAMMHTKINRKILDILNFIKIIQIIKICEEILSPSVPMALRFKGILMGGVVIVYVRNVKLLFVDVSGLLFLMVEVDKAWKIIALSYPTFLPKGKSQTKYKKAGGMLILFGCDIVKETGVFEMLCIHMEEVIFELVKWCAPIRRDRFRSQYCPYMNYNNPPRHVVPMPLIFPAFRPPYLIVVLVWAPSLRSLFGEDIFNCPLFVGHGLWSYGTFVWDGRIFDEDLEWGSDVDLRIGACMLWPNARVNSNPNVSVWEHNKVLWRRQWAEHGYRCGLEPKAYMQLMVTACSILCPLLHNGLFLESFPNTRSASGGRCLNVEGFLNRLSSLNSAVGRPIIRSRRHSVNGENLLYEVQFHMEVSAPHYFINAPFGRSSNCTGIVHLPFIGNAGYIYQ